MQTESTYIGLKINKGSAAYYLILFKRRESVYNEIHLKLTKAQFKELEPFILNSKPLFNANYDEIRQINLL